MSPQRGKSAGRSAPPPAHRGERLQKVLAAAGVASRRECEELISSGRVEVDRQIITELGTRVDPQTQEIRVDGTALARRRHVYYLVNKPPGIVSTNRDPEGRTRVIDLVPDKTRLFPVGRLDRSSEGLMLVTNDGELANRMTHPRYEIAKTYRVRVAGRPSSEELNALRKGVHLAEGVARVASIRVKARQQRSTDLEIVLDEGRNREIRRILARVGHKVMQLRRIAMGPLRLGDLPTGAYRQLTPDEVRQLRASLGRHIAHRSGEPRRSNRAASATGRRTAQSTGRPSDGSKGRTPRKKAKTLGKKSSSTGTIIGAGGRTKRPTAPGARKKTGRSKGRPQK